MRGIDITEKCADFDVFFEKFMSKISIGDGVMKWEWEMKLNLSS